MVTAVEVPQFSGNTESMAGWGGKALFGQVDSGQY